MSKPSQIELDRAHACITMLSAGLAKAQDQGGKNAMMHVGDVAGLIRMFMDGDMDNLAGKTGPFPASKGGTKQWAADVTPTSKAGQHG